jgi:hypothetical protein
MRLLPEPDRFRETDGMGELPSDDVDIFHESGVFYHDR